VIEKIVEGKVEKYFSDVCLYEQPFVKEPEKTVQALMNDVITQLGENLNIRRFARCLSSAKALKRRKRSCERSRCAKSRQLAINT